MAAGRTQLPNPKQGTSIAQRHPALFRGRAKQAALNSNAGNGTEPGAAQASQNSDRACFKDSSLVSPESSSPAARFARGSTRRSCQPRAPAVGARLPCQPAPSSFAELLGFLTRQHRGVQKVTLRGKAACKGVWHVARQLGTDDLRNQLGWFQA